MKNTLNPNFIKIWEQDNENSDTWVCVIKPQPEAGEMKMKSIEEANEYFENQEAQASMRADYREAIPKPEYSEQRIQMQHTWWMDKDTPITFKRSIVGWIAVLGSDYVVQLQQHKTTWFVYRRQGGTRALEPIAKGKTALEAMQRAKLHFLSLYASKGPDGY